MTPDTAQRHKLTALLDELAATVESLLRTGLAAASPATVDRLAVAFTEASRMRLLRLGSTLRIANEEVRRHLDDSPLFSASRLAMFLNRAWLLSRAMGRALRDEDDARFAELNASGAAQSVERVEVVTVGVAKRIVRDVVNIFDFRMRVVCEEAGAEGLKRGDAVQWSCVYPAKPGADLPAEAFLQLPHKLAQREPFRPAALLEPRTFVFTNAMLREGGDDQSRTLMISPDAVVKPGDAFNDHAAMLSWDADAAQQRIRDHHPGPLDLDVELTEEVVLDAGAWTIAAQPERRDDHHDLYPVTLTDTGVTLHARVPITDDGAPLRNTLTQLATAKPAPKLFGLVHYESCRLILQPLSTITDAGIQHLQLAMDKVSKAELVKALSFDT